MELLITLSIAESSSRSAFLEKFDTLINNHDNVAKEHLPNGMKTSILQTSIRSDKLLLNSWNACTQAKVAAGLPANIKYEEFFLFLSGQAKLFDLDNARKVTRQAHQSHTYYDDEVDDGDDYASTLAHFVGIEDPEYLEHVLQCHRAYQ